LRSARRILAVQARALIVAETRPPPAAVDFNRRHFHVINRNSDQGHPMSTKNEPLTLKFSCPVELEGKLPPPVPASLGLPDWLKAMPTKAFSSINLRDEETVK